MPPPTPTPSPLYAHPPELEELAWAEGGAGPEETFRKTPRPPTLDPIPERMHLRVEHQMLQRVPRTGAVVFTIRVYLTPFEELGRGEAGRLAGLHLLLETDETVERGDSHGHIE